MHYPWYGPPNARGHGGHWGQIHEDTHSMTETTDYPIRGPYDSCDLDLIDWQIDLAKSNSITGFICSWWGQQSRENRCCAAVLDRAEQRNFKFSIYWEKENKGPEQIQNAVSDLVYLLGRYGTNKAFLKVDGKPVIFVYGRVLSQIPRTAWRTIIAQTRAEVGSFLLIADSNQTNDAAFFDGVHRYNISSPVAQYSRTNNLAQLRSIFAQNYLNAVNRAHQYGHIACVTVIPGYNDTKVNHPGRIADRKDGQVYRILWEDAIRAKPDWVLITSWNEWHEGTEIEPSMEYGDKYIKLTGEYARRFLAR